MYLTQPLSQITHANSQGLHLSQEASRPQQPGIRGRARLDSSLLTVEGLVWG